jgi:predicted CXXCH cytochrome family protein
MMKQAVLHPPFAGGDCSGCHDNHQSDFPHRLVQEGNALCYQCHPDKGEAIKARKVVHAPVKQSCVQCHSPHGSSSPALLSAPVPELCATCHPGQTTQRQRVITKHGPMVDQKSCRNCHDPHYSDQPRLLRAPQLALCLTCHDRELESSKGKVMNMKAHLEANKNGHGPVKSGDCVTCHDPHGSDNWRILVKYYPAEFYTSFAEGRYALCFSCHDKAAFLERFTGSAMGFRDGDRNLHFIHVNKLAKGRTCRACHEVHADSGQASHVKQTVKFSGWAMPMNFSPGKNGGTCAPGCHGEKRYSR